MHSLSRKKGIGTTDPHASKSLNKGAESTLTDNATSPFQAEPRHRLVLLRTPDFKMSEGHTAPNGVFEGLFAAAEKVSVRKLRGRFAACLIWQINSLTAVGEYVMDFKDLLTKQGFDLDKVMVLRHRPKEPALRKVLPSTSTQTRCSRPSLPPKTSLWQKVVS